MKQAGRRIGALLLVVLLMGTLTVTAFAANKTVSFKDKATVQITTAKWFWWWNKKDTTVTFTNTGEQLVNIEIPTGFGLTRPVALGPGASRSFTASGNNKTYTCYLSQNWFFKSNNVTKYVKITTSAGSISITSSK